MYTWFTVGHRPAFWTVAIVLIIWCTPTAEACFPCFDIPATPISPPITVTPFGAAPTPVVKKADEVVNQTVAPTVQNAANTAVTIGKEAVAPQVHVINVIKGSESLSDAAKHLVEGQGAQVSAIGETVSAINAAENNIKIVAAESITGDVGKTVMTILTGTNRLQVEFAATNAIEAGKLIGGKLRPEELVAAPLAAGLRAAEKQFEPNAKPIPSDVKELLEAFFSPDVLNAARWVVGSVSISVPDVTNNFQRVVFQRDDYAVTVGHVTVFSHDPGSSYHWWAHELQHQVQYREWGIDSFAYKYVTSCHEVEQGAEDQAQRAVPTGLVSLGC